MKHCIRLGMAGAAVRLLRLQEAVRPDFPFRFCLGGDLAIKFCANEGPLVKLPQDVMSSEGTTCRENDGLTGRET
jgi:hypothetical protein